jgi:hypothetical protein
VGSYLLFVKQYGWRPMNFIEFYFLVDFPVVPVGNSMGSLLNGVFVKFLNNLFG